MENKEKTEDGVKSENNEEKKEFRSSYTKGQRIAAMVGAVLLVLLYIITLISAITTSPATPELFKMCIGASILLPIMFWLYIRFAKLFMEHDRKHFGK